MELLVVRHARAEDRDLFAKQGLEDDLRPLTDEGIERMIQGAKGLKRIYPEVDLILTSPLTRAIQTAELLASRYGCPMESSKLLCPEVEPKQLITELATRSQVRIVVVGHEPELGLLICQLLSGSRESYLPLKKGSATLLNLPSGAAMASASLNWSLTSKQLRMLGR